MCGLLIYLRETALTAHPHLTLLGDLTEWHDVNSDGTRHFHRLHKATAHQLWSNTRQFAITCKSDVLVYVCTRQYNNENWDTILIQKRVLCIRHHSKTNTHKESERFFLDLTQREASQIIFLVSSSHFTFPSLKRELNIFNCKLSYYTWGLWENNWKDYLWGIVPGGWRDKKCTHNFSCEHWRAEATLNTWI